MVTVFTLETLLREQSVSQHELARITGLSYQTIHRIANNKTARVDLETLDLIAQHLGVDPGDLFAYVPGRRPTKKRAKKGRKK